MRNLRSPVTVTPPGLRPGCKHSDRTKVLSVVLWGLGLSFRDAALVMKGLGVPISHVEIIYNVREMGANAMARQKKAVSRMKAPVLGADETEVKLSGNGVTLGFLTDPSSGDIVGMEILTSREGEELGRWLVEAAQHFGAKALVSDELESYKPAAEQAGLEHQLCLAHWRKAIARRLKPIEGYLAEKKLITMPPRMRLAGAARSGRSGCGASSDWTQCCPSCFCWRLWVRCWRECPFNH